MGGGAVEDGALATAKALLGDIAADTVNDEARLVHLVKGGVALDGLALAALGPEVLAQAAGVVGDEGVGGLENGPGGAVVLFQAHHLGVGVVALEALHVLHFGPAPAIDGLVVVPHQEEVVPLPGQQPQPGVLDGIGVLELVHQDVGEALLVVVADVGPVTQQLVGTE